MVSLLFFACNCFLLRAVLGSVLQVSIICEEESNCIVLTDALKQLTSNQTLNLSAGTHQITEYVFISDVEDVSITGGGETEVVLTCGNGIGLSFMNVTGLELSGFTVDGCGLTGQPISEFVEAVKQDIDMWFHVPLTVRYAIVLGNCWNVNLSFVHITNTTGLGLLGINIMGYSDLTQVSFTHNIRQSCIQEPARYPFKSSEEVLNQIGGGAYFLYQDYHSDTKLPLQRLKIIESNFSHNAECSYAGITQVNLPNFATFIEGQYQVGAGGGLSIFLAQTAFSVGVSATNTTFFRNDARYGAGAHIAAFARASPSLVTFEDCLFEENGVTEGDITYNQGGAGLAIFLDLFSPFLFDVISNPKDESDTISVQIIDSNFLSNLATVQGGGLMVYSLFTSSHHIATISRDGHYSLTLSFLRCSFRNNSAQSGAAMYVYQNVNEGIIGSVNLTLTDVTITASKKLARSSSQRTEFPSALALLNVNTAVKGLVQCSDNEMSGLMLSSTLLVIDENSSLRLERNIGLLGGGIFITGTGSIIVLNSNSLLQLFNNVAAFYGGGIYASQTVDAGDVLRPVDQASGCILTPFPTGNDYSFNLTLANISVELLGNRALFAGSVVYGSTLESCTWTRFLEETKKEESIFQTLFETSTFLIDERPDSSASVSTISTQMKVTGRNGTMNITAFPGQTVPINITVLDDFGQAVSAVVSSLILNGSLRTQSMLDSGNFALLRGANTTVNLNILGSEQQEFQISFFDITTLASALLNVTLQPCILGFEFDTASQKCVCDGIFNDTEIECELSNFTLVSPDGVWVGETRNSSNLTYVAVASCNFEYCNEGRKSFRPPDYDEQCADGRTGVLCGGCKPGFSVTMGTGTECRRCNHWYLLLIPLFGVLGILLFLAIALLELTVEKGWVYSIILYCNLVTLTPTSLPGYSVIPLFIPSYLLSLQIGVSVCLFDGMTALQRSCLKLIFPLYLFILMAIFTLVNKKVSISSRFSPIKTFITLSIMSYSSIVRTSVEVLSVKTITTLRNESFRHWLTDPNVTYFQGLHGALVFLICVLLVIYLIPVPILLMLPELLYKILSRFAPVWDALWEPFKLRLRFWLGMRLNLQYVLFFTVGASTFNSVGILACALVLLVIIEIQLSVRPFKVTWISIIDSILLGHVLALVVGVFFAKMNGNEELAIFFVTLTLLSGYGIIIGMLIYHFSRMFKLKRRFQSRWSSFVKRVKVIRMMRVEVRLDSLQGTDRGSSPSTEDQGSDEQRNVSPLPTVHDHCNSSTASTIIEQPTNFSRSTIDITPQQEDFSRLREPLLDD